MLCTTPTPILRNESLSHHLDSDHFVAQAYGHTIAIIQTGKDKQEKLKLIMEIFNAVMEVAMLQKHCIEELEKENHMLSDANDQFITKQRQFTDKMSRLVTQIHFLARKNGLINKENNQFKQNLEEIIKEKQALIDKQVLLEKENNLLAGKVKSLYDTQAKFEDLLKMQKQVINQGDLLQEEADQLLEQNEMHLSKREEITQALKQIQKKNKQLEDELEELEFQKRKEIQVNLLDEIGYIATGVTVTTAAILSGGLAIPSLLVGGAVYGFYQLSKQHIKYNIENSLKQYAAKNPAPSKIEVWKQVMCQQSANQS